MATGPSKHLQRTVTTMKHFLYYWKHEEIEALREYPNEFIDHLGSDQLKRADVGDQIFIIGYENGSMLLLGLLDVDLIVDFPTAQKILGRDNIIKKDLHAIAKDDRYLPCLIPVDDLLPDLDVITADSLERIGLPIHPNRFQTMRRLTEASAKKLHEYYDSEFDGPNNLLERDEEEKDAIAEHVFSRLNGELNVHLSDDAVGHIADAVMQRLLKKDFIENMAEAAADSAADSACDVIQNTLGIKRSGLMLKRGGIRRAGGALNRTPLDEILDYVSDNAETLEDIQNKLKRIEEKLKGN